MGACRLEVRGGACGKSRNNHIETLCQVHHFTRKRCVIINMKVLFWQHRLEMEDATDNDIIIKTDSNSGSDTKRVNRLWVHMT